MKPGSRDIKVNILITGEELEELQKHTWSMVEAFGLDRRIEQYKGKRPIGLYQWDMECLIMMCGSHSPIDLALVPNALMVVA